MKKQLQFFSFLLLFTLACNVLFPKLSSSTKTPDPSINITPVDTQTTISEIDGMALVYVPAGEFIRGVDADDALQDCMNYRSNCERSWFVNAEPVQSISLDGFWVDQTEVTNRMYSLCVDAGVCMKPKQISSETRTEYFGNPEYDDFPVVYVDWGMAKSYCEWAGRRLLTEAEWEKAARGVDGRGYPWGNEIDCTFANYYTIGVACIGDTTKVGSYPKGASIYGALDMVGNVWEWVADLYDKNYYKESPLSNPLGASDGYVRIARGGSWSNSGSEIHLYFRHERPSDFSDFNFGFRCAISD